MCDDSFSEMTASVLCRTMNLRGGIPKKQAFFGKGSGPIWLDEVICVGNEYS